MNGKEQSEQLLDYGTKYLENGMRAWERYVQAVSDSAKDDCNVEAVQKKFTDFAQLEGAETMNKLMQINYDYYMSLMNAYFEFTEHMVQASLKDSETQAAVTPSAGDEVLSTSTSKNIDLHFTARKGVLQKEAFVVANKQAEEVEVSFEVSELICEDGQTGTTAPANFKPDRFLLKQGEEQVVECQLKLSKPLAAGLQHVALARVVGFQDLFVRLIIEPGK